MITAEEKTTIEQIRNALITAMKWISIERTDEDNAKDVNDHLDKMLGEFSQVISLIESLPVEPSGELVDDCRKAFEAWNKAVGYSWNKTTGGRYFNPYTEARWIAWQAAWSVRHSDNRYSTGIKQVLGISVDKAQDAAYRIYENDAFIDAAVKYRFENGALMSVAQAVIAALNGKVEL